MKSLKQFLTKKNINESNDSLVKSVIQAYNKVFYANHNLFDPSITWKLFGPPTPKTRKLTFIEMFEQLSEDKLIIWLEYCNKLWKKHLRDLSQPPAKTKQRVSPPSIREVELAYNKVLYYNKNLIDREVVQQFFPIKNPRLPYIEQFKKMSPDQLIATIRYFESIPIDAMKSDKVTIRIDGELVTSEFNNTLL